MLARILVLSDPDKSNEPGVASDLGALLSKFRRAPYKIIFGMIDRREKNVINVRWRSANTFLCLPGSFVTSQALLETEPWNA